MVLEKSLESCTSGSTGIRKGERHWTWPEHFKCQGLSSMTLPPRPHLLDKTITFNPPNPNTEANGGYSSSNHHKDNNTKLNKTNPTTHQTNLVMLTAVPRQMDAVIFQVKTLVIRKGM